MGFKPAGPNYFVDWLNDIFRGRYPIIFTLCLTQMVASFYFLFCISIQALLDTVTIPGVDTTTDFYRVRFTNSMTENDVLQYTKRVLLFGISWMFVLGASLLVLSLVFSHKLWRSTYHLLIRLLPPFFLLPTLLNMMFISYTIYSAIEYNWEQFMAYFFAPNEVYMDYKVLVLTLLLLLLESILCCVCFIICLLIILEVKHAYGIGNVGAPLIMSNNSELPSESWSRHTCQAGRGPRVLRTKLDYRLYRCSTYSETLRKMRFAKVQEHLSIFDLSALNTEGPVELCSSLAKMETISAEYSKMEEGGRSLPLFDSQGRCSNKLPALTACNESSLI